MINSTVVSEDREVSGFDRVLLRDYGELVIIQGEKESLTIEAERDVLATIKTEVKGGSLDIRITAGWLNKLGRAIATGLTRKWIKYRLTVKKLNGIEIHGAAGVSASGLKVDHLLIILGGAGSIKVESLDAKQLDIELRGAGKIELSGRTSGQNVIISGAGGYISKKLESKKAAVDLTGVGSAIVWVTEDLDAAIHGVGSVKYYGSPSVKEKVSGLGRLTHMGNP